MILCFRFNLLSVFDVHVCIGACSSESAKFKLDCAFKIVLHAKWKYFSEFVMITEQPEDMTRHC